MNTVETLLLLLGMYTGPGLVFAVAFAARGAAATDPAACGAPLGFRLLLLPGATLFWPWLLARWLRPPSENSP